METAYVLHIYEVISGQFSGVIYRNTDEIGRVCGCKNQLEVFKTAQDSVGFDIDFVVDGISGESLSALKKLQNGGGNGYF